MMIGDGIDPRGRDGVAKGKCRDHAGSCTYSYSVQTSRCCYSRIALPVHGTTRRDLVPLNCRKGTSSTKSEATSFQLRACRGHPNRCCPPGRVQQTTSRSPSLEHINAWTRLAAMDEFYEHFTLLPTAGVAHLYPSRCRSTRYMSSPANIRAPQPRGGGKQAPHHGDTPPPSIIIRSHHPQPRPAARNQYPVRPNASMMIPQ